jgi:hypothetical protein
MNATTREPLLRYEWYAARVAMMTPDTVAVNLRDLRVQAAPDFRWNDGKALTAVEAVDTQRCIELLESVATDGN